MIKKNNLVNFCSEHWITDLFSKPANNIVFYNIILHHKTKTEKVPFILRTAPTLKIVILSNIRFKNFYNNMRLGAIKCIVINAQNINSVQRISKYDNYFHHTPYLYTFFCVCMLVLKSRGLHQFLHEAMSCDIWTRVAIHLNDSKACHH